MNTNTHQPIWGAWSPSKSRTYRQCPRAYFHRYSPLQIQSEAHHLRKLISLDQARGQAIHEAIYRAISDAKAQEVRPDEIYVEWALRSFACILAASWHSRCEPLKDLRFLLLDHHQNQWIPDARITKAQGEIAHAISQFMSHQLWEVLGSIPSAIHSHEERLSAYMGGVSLAGVPDLVLRRSETSWTIVDFKSGKSHDSHARQAIAYDVLLRATSLELRNHTIYVAFVYLNSGKERVWKVTPADRARFLEMLKKEHACMEQGAEADDPEEAFPPLSGKHCEWCNFQSICPEEERL